MPETNDSPYPVSEPVSEAAAARAKFEQEKMSRRAALRKIGLTSGMALFGMFAVDDLARLAMRGLQQHKETQAVAETVAKELRSSGVAFAADGDDSGYYDCVPCTLIPDKNDNSCRGGQTCKRKDKDACWNCVHTKDTCLAKSDAGKARCLELAGRDLQKQADCNNYFAGETQGCRNSYATCCSDNQCNC